MSLESVLTLQRVAFHLVSLNCPPRTIESPDCHTAVLRGFHANLGSFAQEPRTSSPRRAAHGQGGALVTRCCLHNNLFTQTTPLPPRAPRSSLDFKYSNNPLFLPLFALTDELGGHQGGAQGTHARFRPRVAGSRSKMQVCAALP